MTVCFRAKTPKALSVGQARGNNKTSERNLGIHGGRKMAYAHAHEATWLMNSVVFSCLKNLPLLGWRGEWQRLAAGVEGTGFQVPSFVAELQISRDPETWPGGSAPHK